MLAWAVICSVAGAELVESEEIGEKAQLSCCVWQGHRQQELWQGLK